MSEATQVENTGNQAHVTFDTAKIFIRNNRFESDTLNNDSGGDLVIPIGTLLGRDSTDGKLRVLASAGINNRNIPVGVLAQEVSVLDTADATDVNYCVGGDVAKEKIIFDGADDFDTVVSGRTLGDRIAADTLGVKAVETIELTGTDNE